MWSPKDGDSSGEEEDEDDETEADQSKWEEVVI